MQLGNQSVDLMQIPKNSVWRDAFPPGSVRWEGGWRTLWEQAANSIATGSDYLPGRVSLEVQAYFRSGQMGSIGAIVNCQRDDVEEIDAAARRLLARVCGGDEIVDGCIGLVSNIEDPSSRPCLTLLVSGPSGGAEAAMMVRRALPEWNVNAGVAMRTIRSGSVGVLKVPYLPELYLKVGHPCFGIRWDVWRAIAGTSPTYEWNSACLLWCNAVVQSVQGISEKIRLMIDDVYFDAMQTIPLSQQHLRESIESEKLSLGLLLKEAPEKFLFGAGDA